MAIHFMFLRMTLFVVKYGIDSIFLAIFHEATCCCAEDAECEAAPRTSAPIALPLSSERTRGRSVGPVEREKVYILLK